MLQYNVLSMAFYWQYNTKLIKPLDIHVYDMNVLFATKTVFTQVYTIHVSLASIKKIVFMQALS